jgi:hypothetical protein
MAMPQRFRAYNAPAVGRGSVKSLAKNFARNGNAVSACLALMYQNKPHGYACSSCAWAKPASPHVFEFCENGAKATAWESTQKRATPEFLAKHTPRLAAHWETSTATG